MKRIVAIVVAFGLVALGGMHALPARAAVSSSGPVTMAAGEVHTGLYAKMAERVEIDGTVNGDVAVLASSFVLKGTVNGSVYVLAQTVQLDGTVSGNVHVMASDVSVAGSAQSVYAAASSFVTTKESKMDSTLAAAAANADVAGSVGHSAYIGASKAAYNAATGGSVKIAAQEITVGPSAVIAGDLSYSESAQIQVENDKNISGSIKKFATPKTTHTPTWVSVLTKVFFGLVSSFVLGMVLLWLAPGSVVATGEFLRRKPANALLTGFGFLIGGPIVLFMLAITLIGLPLAVLGIMLYIAALMVANVFVAILVGRRVLATGPDCVSARANTLPLLVGLLIIGLVSALPAIGGVMSFAVTIGGIGALVARSWQRLGVVRKAQIAR